MTALSASAAKSFNSRAREGRDRNSEAVVALGRVSILAPARGATPPSSKPPASRTSFQFSRPRGARQLGLVDVPRRDVSILAPARGATRTLSTARSAWTRFNSRAREGRDEEAGGVVRLGAAVSILAPARGATCRRPWTPSGRMRFNSRAREGRDTTASPSRRGRNVSILAPARGAT